MTPEERNIAWALAQARAEAKDARDSARTAMVMACLSMASTLITAWLVIGS